MPPPVSRSEGPWTSVTCRSKQGRPRPDRAKAGHNRQASQAKVVLRVPRGPQWVPYGTPYCPHPKHAYAYSTMLLALREEWGLLAGDEVELRGLSKVLDGRA